MSYDAGRFAFPRVRLALDIITTVAIVVGTAVVVLSSYQRGQPAQQIVRAVGWEPVSGTTTVNAKALNPPGAKLMLMEFSDFQCPFCGKYATQILPEIRHDFVDSGRVAYMFRSFPLRSIHPLAAPAAVAAECSNAQGRFWEMHDRLFAHQSALQEADLVEHATAIGLDPQKFSSCLRSTARGLEEDEAEGKRLGVMSTPTLMIGTVSKDGRVHLLQKLAGVSSFETVKTALDVARKQTT